MTLLWTLLTTFFVDDGPFVPQPATTGAITYESQYAEESTDPVANSFNVPRLTPRTWHHSPSWAVASPSGKPKAFDVYSPAARPPQEFPGLLPCDPVALVPCPAPSGEPPAVRHVSYAGDANFRLAKHEKPADSECPSVCPHSSVGKSEWQELHARSHAGPHPPVPFLASVYPPPHPVHPVAFRQPVYAEAAPMPPIAHHAGPFPGAKNVRHVVSATYDVPHETAAALKPILEKGEGVLGCKVDCDELTITAHAPAQAVISQFLAGMDLIERTPQTTRPADNPYHPYATPVPVIDVKQTETKCENCCNGKCDCKGKCQCDSTCCGKTTEVKTTKGNCESCCKGKCQCDSKCCPNTTEVKTTKGNCESCCKGKCQCDGKSGGKKKDATASFNPFETPMAKSLAYHYYSLVNPSSVEQCTGVFEPVRSCPEGTSCPASCETKAVEWKASKSTPIQPKMIQVTIQAGPNGVVLRTSEGTSIQADRIQLQTNGLGTLSLQKVDSVETKNVKPASALKSTLKPLPTY